MGANGQIYRRQRLYVSRSSMMRLTPWNWMTRSVFLLSAVIRRDREKRPNCHIDEFKKRLVISPTSSWKPWKRESRRWRSRPPASTQRHRRRFTLESEDQQLRNELTKMREQAAAAADQKKAVRPDFRKMKCAICGKMDHMSLTCRQKNKSSERQTCQPQMPPSETKSGSDVEC